MMPSDYVSFFPPKKKVRQNEYNTRYQFSSVECIWWGRGTLLCYLGARVVITFFRLGDFFCVSPHGLDSIWLSDRRYKLCILYVICILMAFYYSMWLRRLRRETSPLIEGMQVNRNWKFPGRVLCLWTHREKGMDFALIWYFDEVRLDCNQLSKLMVFPVS